MNDENPKLYDVARDACHSIGMNWTDPRTGVTYPAPTDNAESVAEKAKRARYVLDLFQTMTNKEFVEAIGDKTVSLPVPLEPAQRIAICYPVAESHRKVLRAIAGEDLPSIKPDSVVRQCTMCGLFIWVGPRLMAVVSADSSFRLVCAVCAFDSALSQEYEMHDLGNPDDARKA